MDGSPLICSSGRRTSNVGTLVSLSAKRESENPSIVPLHHNMATLFLPLHQSPLLILQVPKLDVTSSQNSLLILPPR